MHFEPHFLRLAHASFSRPPVAGTLPHWMAGGYRGGTAAGSFA